MSEKNKAILEATLSVKDDLTGSLGIPVERIYPDLEDVTIKPSTEEQKWKSKMYGYNEITIEPVTSEIDEDIQPENIKAGTNILGVDGKETVVDTEDATAMAENILEGQTAYVNGEKINGSIETYDGSLEGISELPDENLYLVRVIDYDGTTIKDAWLTPGSVFTMPDEPEHDNLIFQGWSSPVDIIDNTVIAEDQDIIIGPMYTTVSGASEFDIEVTKVTGLTIGISKPSGMTSIDWGDGTVDTLLTHTYTDYGEYTVKMYGVKKFGGALFQQSYYDYNGKMRGLLKRARIADGVEGTTSSTFQYSQALKSVSLPITFRYAGRYAFGDCYSLVCIVLPLNFDGNSDDYGYFSQCYQMKYCVLPKGLTIVDNAMLSNNYSLEYLSLPESIIDIAGGLASNCHNLKRIKLPSHITRLINSSCSNTYMKHIVLPKSLIEIGQYTFASSMFEEFILPDNITKIGTGAFQSCKKMKKIILPKNLTEIPASMCSSCYVLENIDIPDTVIAIGGSAFSNCYTLKTIAIPFGITEIKGATFSACKGLTLCDFIKVKQVPTLVNINAFTDTNQALKIVVPDELYDEWIVATNWTEYADYIYKKSEVSM